MSSVTFASGVLGAFTQLKIRELSTDAVRAITSSNILELTSQQLGWFLPGQVPSIQPAVLASVSYLNMTGFANECVAAFTADQIRALTNEQVAALSEVSAGDSKFAHFTASQMASVSVGQFPSIDVNTFPLLSADQVNHFTPAAASAISQAQFAKFGQSQIDGLFGPASPSLIQSVDIDKCISRMTPAQLVDVGNSHVSSLSASQIAGLSVGTFQTVSSEQLQNMTDAQLAAITRDQFLSLSAIQMNTGIGARMNNIKVECIGGLTEAQVGALSSDSVKALTQAQLQSLTSLAQVQGLGSKMSDTQYPKLTGAQIANLSYNVIAALHNDVVAALSTGSQLMKNMTPAQLASVSAGQFPSIDASLFPLLSTAQINSFTSSAIEAMSAAQSSLFPLLSTAQINAFKPSTIEAVTAAQFRSLGQNQINGLFGPVNKTLVQSVSAVNCISQITSTQLSWVGDSVSTLTPAQIAVIAPNVFKTMSNAQLSELTEQQYRAVTSDQFAALSASQINFDGIGVNVSEITPNCVSAISYATLAGLNPTSAGSLTADQLNAISSVTQGPETAPRIQALNVTAVSASQIGYLTSTQIAAMSNAQVGALSTSQIQTVSAISNSDSQLIHFTTPMLGAITAAQFPSINPDVFGLLSHTQIASFSASALATMTQEQFAKFDKEQIDGLFVVDSTRIGSVTTAIISGISGHQLLAIGTGNIGALSTSQFASIPAALFSYTAVNGMSNAMISVLTDAELGAMTPAQFAQLTYEQINAAVSTRYGKVGVQCVPTNVQMAGFNTNVLNAFTPAQIRALPAENFQYLSIYQIGYLTASQILALNADADIKKNLSYQQSVAVSQNVLGFTDVQLSALPVSSINSNYPPVYQLALLGSKAAFLSATQLNALTAEQFAVISVSDISPRVINLLKGSLFSASFTGAMTVDQVAAMNAAVTGSLSRDAAQAIMNSAKVNSMNYFGSITPSAFDAGFTNAALVSVSKAQSMTAPQVAAFLNITSLSNEALQGLMNVTSTNLFAAISNQSLVAISPTIFGVGFTNAASIIPAQAQRLTPSQLGALTNASVQALTVQCFQVLSPEQVVGFTPGQVAVMSTAQIEALHAVSKVIIMGVKNNTISPLNINLTAFNTLLTSPYFSSAKTSPEVILAYDATVSLTIPITAVQSMFQYQNNSDATVRLYFDKTKFAVAYNYGASSYAVKDISASMYPSEPDLFGTHTFRYPTGLKWDGPVTSNSIPGDTNIALSWDYILYTAQKVFNNWVAYSYFNNIYSSEKSFRDALNGAVNTHIDPVLEAVDVTNPSANGAEISKILDANEGKYYTLLQQGSTPNNVSSTVFDYMYSRQPQRFISPDESENELYSYPFISGDTLNFLLQVNANEQQTVLETNPSGVNTVAVVKTRTYLIKMTITSA